MLKWAIYSMIYLGAALMVYNIICFARFARFVRQIKTWESKNRLLQLPILLLVLFLIGYLAIGIFGKPDIIIAGVLFGGSIFVYVMYVLLDGITRQIMKSERMAAELAAAENSSKTKTAFLATISHEMRTPMNVILGIDSIELKKPELPLETRRHLETIDHSGRHLLGLINNILDLNHIEAGGLAISNEPFCLSDTLNQIDAIVKTLCEEKGLEFNLAIDDGVWGWYMGDHTQLQRVLLCILDNAVKYTPVPGSVRFSANRAPLDDGRAELTFTVADTGVGMDEAFIPKAFEPFSQEDDSFTNRFGGSGIGLSIAKRIVDCMGGAISATSKKNAGSTFTVKVPLAVTEPPQLSGEDLDISLEGRRVLIVEDLPDNAEIEADLLELEGVESEIAENGKIAVDMIAASPEGHYDAVLMDLRMPEMDGLASARCIRQMDRADTKVMPIIAVTANTSQVDAKNVLEAGMNAHLGKPVEADLLYSTLKQTIRAVNFSGGGGVRAR